MPVIALKVTGPPSSAADRGNPQAVKPLFRGNGDTDYVCGCCGAVIAAGMGPLQHVIVDNTVCPGCGSENEFPPGLRA
jgi:hypothetical protein